MSFATTAIFYLTIGVSVSAAVYLRDDRRSGRERLFRVLGSILSWPMYLPLLLERSPDRLGAVQRQSTRLDPPDALARAIDQVESELNGAIGSLNGWAEGVLADERPRLDELRAAWRAQADYVRELDRMLAKAEFTLPNPLAEQTLDNDALPVDRRLQSDHARAENIRRLHELRHSMRDDLLGSLAWVRELVTMIYLAKFSGAPAARVGELVSQIAAAIEGLWGVSDARNFEQGGAPAAANPAQSDQLATGVPEIGRTVERSAPASVLSVAPETA